jgi:hypothetical protein
VAIGPLPQPGLLRGVWQVSERVALFSKAR